LLEHAGRYLNRTPKRQEVLAVYAGLRPLVKAEGADSTAALSRDHTILVSRTGLLTIVGGKWTTYRKMGEDVINRASVVANLEVKESPTPEMRLHAAPDIKDAGAFEPGSQDEALSMYGLEADQVRALANENPTLAAPIHADLPYIKAEIVWGVRHEMARTLEDVLSRRTRSLTLNARAALEAAPEVARLMAEELTRGAAWEEAQLEAFRDRVTKSLLT
jgi:glycerol-3-phosphate dehydrogenase